MVLLHYCSDATPCSGARFDQGQGIIYLDELACNGSEYRLIDCAYDGDTSDCRHYEDASVLCSDACKRIYITVDFKLILNVS